ncbi:sugar ABC transporter substrate-binding protein [Dyadobacter alkalitolerans]|uniref:sugar ABC transporter substrate-binding protein n=1 Tax=Dyadobacter alkalitolerans TaxID=492736 RepID=UPI000429C0CF|nr:sugar ABC transporter substrate-binding protein [Dyadobacter alkalitolerans]
MIKTTKYALLVALALTIASCNQSGKGEGGESGSDKKLVVGSTMLSMQNEFIVNVSDEMEARAKALGVELITVDAERSALKQVEQVESFIAQGVDAIIMNPCEVEASSPAVKLAMDAKIPIINVNSETSAKPSAFVGSDDTESARIAMKYLVEKLGGKGNVLIMHGFMGQAAQLKRDNGAKEILKANPGMKLLAEQTGEWDRAKAMSLMENWIQSYGSKINAVFAHNDEMGMGAVKALEAAGLKDKVIVISVDAIPDALQSVKKGALNATIFQNAQEQGSKAIEIAVKAAKKEQFEREVLIPFQLVTKENVEEYLK